MPRVRSPILGAVLALFVVLSGLAGMGHATPPLHVDRGDHPGGVERAVESEGVPPEVSLCAVCQWLSSLGGAVLAKGVAVPGIPPFDRLVALLATPAPPPSARIPLPRGPPTNGS